MRQVFWGSLFRFQRDKLTLWLAVRNTIGVALPLAWGVALDNVPAGIAVCAGALNVAFSDSEEPYGARARRMLAASFLVGSAVLVGTLCGRTHLIAVAVVGAWAFAAGIVVSISTGAADLGVISLVTLIVFGSGAVAPHNAVTAGHLAFAGGVLQTLLSLASWPLKRYVPERRALGDLYLELARMAESPRPATEAPSASTHSMQAQNALATLDRDHSIEAERYRLLFSEAERMRLSLLTLARLRVRMQRESPAITEGEILDGAFALCVRILDSIGASLLAGTAAVARPEWLQELHTFAEQVRHADGAGSPAAAAMARDARFQMDALAGQLRAAVDLAGSATSAGQAAFKQREARQPWSLRLSGALATLRANLTLRSAACRHAIRLAACVAAGDALARGLELRRSYWLPMTIAIILKPDFSATFSRGVLRLLGTFAGLVFSTALFHALPVGRSSEVALVAVSMFLMRWIGGANYGIFVTLVTALVVALLAMTGVAPKDVMIARAINTVAGGAVALLAYWLWPTWERTQVPQAMAQLLDAYREYFRAIRERYVGSEGLKTGRLEATRVAGRLARSNLEASMDRLTGEPGTPPDSVRAFSGMMAASHRLIHAMMALEAALSGSGPVLPREAFRPFANDVELTLYYQAAALRGSPIGREGMPDLREDHRNLAGSGDGLREPYALVNVETDRITNSLNTLSEEVWGWREKPA